MKNTGIPFFPFPSTDTLAIELLEAKFKSQGINIYLKLMQQIFSDEGYFLQLTDDFILLFTRKIGVRDGIVPAVIEECVSRGIFDKELFEKYKILTSDEIQKEYLNAVRKRKNFDIIQKYRLHFATKFLKMAEENEKTAEEMQKTAEDLNKGKESKEKKSKQTLSNERDNNGGVAPPCHTQQEKFKQATGKYVEDVKSIPLGIDIDLLIEKVNKSDFLKNAKNMTLKNCLKNYDKIIAGCYDNDSKSAKNDGVVISHNYTEDDYKSFFTNLDYILK